MIVLEMQEGDTIHVYLVDVNTRLFLHLSSYTSDYRSVYNSGLWSPDGSQVAVVSQQEENSDITVVNVNTGTNRNLTNHSGENYHPVWSPDGRQVAFETRRDLNNEIHMIDLDTGLLRDVSKGQRQSYNPVWSPNGDRIAFFSHAGNRGDIYVFDLENDAIHNLTDHPATDDSPVWSLDGNLIAFRSDREGLWDFYVLNSDGSGLRNLTNLDTPETLSLLPSWSSYENWLAYANIARGEILILDTNGNKLHSIDNYRQIGAFDSPPWSNDGHRIAYTTFENSNYEIWVADVTTGERVNVSNHPAVDSQPVWIPGANQMVFQSYRDFRNQMFRIDLDTGSLQCVIDLPPNLRRFEWRP